VPNARTKVLLLYKRIFRNHKRILPEHLRKVGDDFVRNEFKMYKNNSKKVDEVIFNRFTSEWEGYLNTLMEQKDEKVKGTLIPKKRRKLFTGDQKKQLKKLKNVINETTKSHDKTNI